MKKICAPSVFKKDQLLNLISENIYFHDGFEGINSVSTPDDVKDNSLFFCDSIDEDRYKFLSSIDVSSAMMICKSSNFSFNNLSIIISDNPRVTYSKIVMELFSYNRDFFQGSIDPRNIHESSCIFPNSFIHHTASIGKNTVIHPNVSIGPNCQIGNNVVIYPGAVIGYPGFGIITDEQEAHHHLPHVGGVVIQDDVEIGHLTTVCSGTINPTIIEENVKTDAHVHIAHNVIVKKNSLVTAHAEVSGSVIIGENSWLGPNCSIKDHLTIGNNAFIGIGAVVTKSVEDNIVVAGNPARPLIKKSKAQQN